VRDFQQIEWDDRTAEDCRAIVRLAVREDFERQHDWTTVALVPADRIGAARFVSRETGVVAGLAAVAVAVEAMQAEIELTPRVEDGDPILSGSVLAELHGNVRDLLSCERILLNLLSRLSGIATQARQYVELVEGTQARIYDTRKTTPGWRRLEKYAVRCGGAYNHRTGLFDAVLIKDNHLAQFAAGGRESENESHCGAGEAVRQARQFLKNSTLAGASDELLVEVEVDTLEQLSDVLSAGPDMVLLDNMSTETLRLAVELRDQLASTVQLEASGGVRLERLSEIAATGVDRISVGALTHAACSLDIGLDWPDA